MNARFFTACLTLTLALAGSSKGDSATYSPTPNPTVSSIATASVSPTPMPTLPPSAFANADAQLRDLENRMDTVFADTFRGMSTWFDQETRANSVDLREQNDKYIARLYVPKGDNPTVNAKVENGVLHITAQNKETSDGKAETEQYEHYIALSKPVQADKVSVQKRQNVIVVSVPKSTPSAPAVAATTPGPAATSSPAATSGDWADTMRSQMNQMQTRLNQTIRDVFQDNISLGASTSQLGSAMNIENQNDKYVVHFYLPDQDVSDAKVKFENNQLHLTAQEQKKSSAAAGDMQSRTIAHYETMTNLPGPVKEAEMKVERRKGSVVVTLPKA